MRQDFYESWKKDEKAAFEGWDFSYIHGRSKSDNLPWDYKKIVQKYLKESNSLLDMGTGGGEFLLSLGHPYDRTTVTEGYLPNLEICQQKLEPLGIGVNFVDEDDRLPFDDNVF